MARATDGNEQLLCSFCGKSQRQVKKLIAGPGVYICDECIDLCNEIIDEELTTPAQLDLDNLPRPKDIYEVLNDYVVSQEEISRDMERDFFLSPQEAVDYGIIDTVITHRDSARAETTT